MLNLKLYTYKNKKTLNKFIENSLKENERLCLLAECNFEFDEELIYYIDISSVIEALKNAEKQAILFTIEQSLINFNRKNTRFIIEEKFSEYVLDNFVLIFNDSEKLCSDFIEEKGVLLTEDNDIKYLKNLSNEDFNRLIINFNDILIGHEGLKHGLEKNLKEFRLFNRINEHKILSIFLFGPSGIGKTEVARILHKLIAPSEKMIKINFGNYSSQGALNSLIGSPRGYIGSEDGELNLKLSKSKSSIILIDEFEKADKQIINFFLELLEDGKYTDLQGIEHDLNGYIIIFTSNIDEKRMNEYITPEFINRINYKVKFNFLNENDKLKYFERRTNQLVNRFNDSNSEKISNDKAKELFDEINISKYSSIRDIEHEIKNKFVDLVDEIDKK